MKPSLKKKLGFGGGGGRKGFTCETNCLKLTILSKARQKKNPRRTNETFLAHIW